MDEHAPALVLYARQWCSAAEDVVQEAFVKLIAQSKTPERIVPWLYRVVRNAAISSSRAANRRRRHETAAAAEMPGWFVPTDGVELDADVAAAAFQTAPVEEREIIVADLWGGLTFGEIAELVGCSSSTAHRRYLAGVSALRERLGVPCPKDHTTPG